MSGARHLELAGLSGRPGSLVHRLDPRAKLLGLLSVTLVAVSASLHQWPVFACCAAILAAVAFAARVPAVTIARRSALILPLILFVGAFLPFLGGGPSHDLGPVSLSQEGIETFALVSIKATIGTAAAVVLGATTLFPDVLRGLEALRAPRLLVLIAGFMYRYVFVVAGELRRMRAGLRARCYRPRNVLQAGALGRMVAALFLRTHARGERVYLAMLARGYSGEVPQHSPLVLRAADVLFVSSVASTLLALRLAVELSP